jgi:tetratricopeptide (TPR) repeat protein
MDGGTGYLALVSGRGYFRLDALKDGSPRLLIGWTEVPGLGAEHINLTIIAFGEHLIFLVDSRWIAEIHDPSVPEGRLGFALANYETGESARTGPAPAYTCQARLDFLSVESRIKKVEEYYRKWNDSALVPAESRFRLAETFAALAAPGAARGAAAFALDQITRAWKQREEAARSVTATYTETRTRRELLLAARMSARLGRCDEAEEYLDACLEQGRDNPEGEAALAEKTGLLLRLNKFPELKKLVREQIVRGKKEPKGPIPQAELYALLAEAHWNLKEYKPAAQAWEKAFGLDKENGLYAVAIARACVLLGKNDEALSRFLEGGRIFLRQDNYEELGALIPKLLSLGERNWEVRALIGKWAYAVGDYEQAESELALSESVRRKLKPRPRADPAVSYLWAMLLVRAGKHREALSFLAEAVQLAPDYGLFHLKLAEVRKLLAGTQHINSPAPPKETARGRNAPKGKAAAKNGEASYPEKAKTTHGSG